MTLRPLALGAILALGALAQGACQRGPSEPPPGSRPAVEPHAPAPSAPAHGAVAPSANDPHAGLGIPPPSGTQAPPLAAPTGGPATSPGSDGVATALQWDDPPGWRREQPASPMRRAQFKIPHTGADTADAEVTVITFGGGMGGGIEPNIQRWLGQLEQTDGRATSEVAQRRSMTVAGLTVTIVEAPGRIRGGGMGMPGIPATPGFERGRMLAAIVETPNGPWFFKAMGGDETVSGARAGFEAMLRSIRVGH
ncbi:MAG: hypothetical protein Q8Q09_24810 [Deltaproteobacteria bacterium]|nr:hypothetical protein [Deltaproteobacteria bacterium]